MRYRLLFAAITLCLAIPCHADSEATSHEGNTSVTTQVAVFEPVSAYDEKTIAGWRVHFHKDLSAKEPELAREVEGELTRQLEAIAGVVPAGKLKLLREIDIWVEHFHPRFPCACYHPSAGWLKENGFNPAKEDSVEISNPRNFVEWSRDQPWMVLHELVHGYHDRVLQHGHPAVRAAFDEAKKSGKYEEVRHINGQTVRHYALSNDEEYLAETTEAFFGKNDFYPFVRAELKEFDPVGYRLMEEIWGGADSL